MRIASYSVLLAAGVALLQANTASAGVIYEQPNIQISIPSPSKRQVRTSTAAARAMNPLGTGSIGIQQYRYVENPGSRARAGMTPQQVEYRRQLAEYERAMAEQQAKAERAPRSGSNGKSAAAASAVEAKVDAYQARAQQAARFYFSNQAQAPGAPAHAPAEETAVASAEGPPQAAQQYRLPGTALNGGSMPRGPGAEQPKSTFWTRLSSVFSSGEQQDK